MLILSDYMAIFPHKSILIVVNVIKNREVNYADYILMHS